MSGTFDPAAFPRSAAYVATLPHGLASYPDCLCRGSGLTFATYAPLLEAPSGLPDEVLEVARRPPGATEWVTEVMGQVLFLALADRSGLGDDDFLDATSREVARRPGGHLLRPLVELTSPELLISVGEIVWRTERRGSVLELVPGDRRCRAVLRYPPHLYDRFLVRAAARSLQDGLGMARATEARAEVVEYDPTRAQIHLSWR